MTMMMKKSMTTEIRMILFFVSIAAVVCCVCAGVPGAASRTDFFDYEVEQNEVSVDGIPFKIETDYTKPTRCQDLETGTFYKVGAEWYSRDPTLCLKMSCERSYFPEVTVTRCSDFFKKRDPKTACNLKKRSSFPHCCSECKVR